MYDVENIEYLDAQGTPPRDVSPVESAMISNPVRSITLLTLVSVTAGCVAVGRSSDDKREAESGGSPGTTVAPDGSGVSGTAGGGGGVSPAQTGDQGTVALGTGVVPGAAASSGPVEPDTASSAGDVSPAQSSESGTELSDAGASDSLVGDTPEAGGPPPEEPSSAEDSGSAAVVDLSAELYDPEHVPRFDIELPETSIAALNGVSDAYAPGTLRYGDEVVSNIGVRIKGEGSWRGLDEKTAFKLKFDKFVTKQAFRGLRRMTFNNMVEDPAFIAERLAYHVFRAADLPAPRCNSALLYVNGEFYGVYANIETEDKTFLRRWFASDDGNLYEEGQVDFLPGAEAHFDLETNETEDNRSDLANLIDMFQSAAPETYLTDLGQALDTDHFLRFTAAEAAVNQWDMYSYTVFYPNNFRIYHDPTTQRFVFLPWGMDMSMKPFRDSLAPHIPVLGLARRGDNARGPVTAGLMFQRCLESPSCQASYVATVREMVTLYESLDLEALAERYYTQLLPHIEADPRKEYTMQQVEQHYQSVLQTIRERPAAMLADVD